MGLIVIALVIGILGSVLGIAGTALGAWALIQVEAMKRSTHSIEYIAPESLMKGPGAPNQTSSDAELEKLAKREGLVPSDDDDFEDL